ncbi:MAG: hypothetical protein RJB01_1592 [Actinomycetota bacterium]
MSPRCPNPILVGGTGRSGSTILGRLLGHHPDLFLTSPEEVRFIANAGGMATTLATAQARWPKNRMLGRDIKRTIRKLNGAWYARPGNSGLQVTVSKEEMTLICEGYAEGMNSNPVDATQRATWAIMDKVTAAAGNARWVDGTPANARVTDLIEPIYPECQVIAIIRDGRDVAASFIEQTFGPNEVFEALDMWAERSLRMHQAVQRCAPGRILTIDMLNLVKYQREESLARVCEFLNISQDPGMVAWFNENVLADKSHAGRWRSQFPSATAKRIDTHYSRLVRRLQRAGVPIPLES